MRRNLGIILGGVIGTTIQFSTHTASTVSSDCKEAACRSKLDSFKSSFNKNKQEAANYKPSPPSREELGQAGWTVLHSFAAYYPEVPSVEEKQLASDFLKGFAHFYPCRDCAEGLISRMKEFPPDVSSRQSLSIWMCETHNEVNEMLGKEKVSCEIAKLNERWRG
jgi:FAD-linked sulfhydryl oxidase